MPATRLALVTTLAAVGQAQFLRPASSSISWMSSSSWVAGADGQMHKQTHEVKTETIRDQGMPVKRTESDTACRDGLCRQTVTVQKPGSFAMMTQQAPEGLLSRFARLRALLRGASFPMVYVEERPAPVAIKFLAPVQVQEAHAPQPSDPFLLAALAASGTTLLALLAATVAKYVRGSEAREAENLGQPLAPQEVRAAKLAKKAAKKAAAAVAAKEEEAAEEPAVPVSAYLERVYRRAEAAAQAAAAGAYLERVYARASA